MNRTMTDGRNTYCNAPVNNPQMTPEPIATTQIGGFKTVKVVRAKQIAQVITALHKSQAANVMPDSLDFRYDLLTIL